MSGGHYDYVDWRMQDAAQTLRSSHPKQSHILALAATLERIADVMHRVDLADSGDTQWSSDLVASIRAVLHPGDELAALAGEEDVFEPLRRLASGPKGDRPDYGGVISCAEATLMLAKAASQQAALDAAGEEITTLRAVLRSLRDELTAARASHPEARDGE